MLDLMPPKKAKLSDDDHKGTQINFRAYSPGLVEAIDAYAEKTCYGNRTMAMNRLIEIALTQSGDWPPPESGKK